MIMPSFGIFSSAENESSFPLKNTRALADTPWPMLGGNARHTGLSQHDTSNNPGKLKWKFTTMGNVDTNPTIDIDGTIYIGSNDNFVYALDSFGELKWKIKTDHKVWSTPAISSNGIIYFGSQDNYLYAIESDGDFNWKYETGGWITSSPVLGSDDTIYVGSDDYNFYSINSDGTLNWKYNAHGHIESSPSLSSDNTIYFGSGDHNLYSLTPDGTLKWQFSTGDAIRSSPTINNDGTIYIGSNDYSFYAINPDGSFKWKFQAQDEIWSSAAIGVDGTIYFGSNDNYIYALYPNGTLKWKFKTGAWVCSSPAIGSDGAIYIGSHDKYLYALNPNGTQKWKFQTGSIIWSQPSIGPDGTVYFGSQDNNFYALNTGCPTPPRNLEASWGDSYVNLSWEVPEDDGGSKILEYKIYKDTISGNESYLASVESSVRYYKDKSVLNGETYFYYITALNKYGESDPSTEINATPMGIPSAPRNLHAIYTEDYVNLTWQLPNNDGGADITGYNIYRGTSSGNESYLDLVDAPMFSYNDYLISNKKTLYYYITAVNSIGESVTSNEAFVYLLKCPSSPQNLAEISGNKYVILQWDAPEDDGGSAIIKYNIYRGVTSSVNRLLTSVDGSTTTCRDDSVVNGKMYYYHVTAVNNIGESEPSVKINATPLKIEEKVEKSSGDFDLGLIIILILIIIIIIVIFTFIKRKKAVERDYKSFFQEPKTPPPQYPIQPPSGRQQYLPMQYPSHPPQRQYPSRQQPHAQQQDLPPQFLPEHIPKRPPQYPPREY